MIKKDQLINLSQTLLTLSNKTAGLPTNLLASSRLGKQGPFLISIKVIPPQDIIYPMHLQNWLAKKPWQALLNIIF